MFDMLTLGQLRALHTSLYLSLSRIHQRMLAKDGTPLIPVFGPDWQILRACHDEMHETMDAVFAEITRRDREAIHA